MQEGAQQCSLTEQPRSADGRMRLLKAEVFGKYLYEEQ